jgi:hypothetical protein
MRRKKFTHAVMFSTTPEVYNALKKDSDEFGISMSDLMRRLTDDYVYGTRTYSRSNLEKKENEGTEIEPWAQSKEDESQC